MPKSYDIAVLGATAAGYVAAITLAKKGRKVIVLSAPGSATESPLADWIPADVVKACPVLGSLRSSGMEAPFRQVHFHSADLEQQAAYRSRTTAGYVLRRANLLSAFAKAARRAGVDRAELIGASAVELQENAVAVRAKRPCQAALLLIAQDRPAEVIARLALPARSVPVGQIAVCGLDIPAGRARLDKALHVVAWPGGRERLGMFFGAGSVLHVRVLSIAAPASGRTAGPAKRESEGQLIEALGQLVARLQGGGLLPARLSLSRATAAIWRPPGGVALELETHLAKRALLIGTAGGFASAMSGQTLDASIRSALVAADVVDRALRGKRLQEALAEYKRKWRNKLADRIRAPGTSLKMLLPIVFANKTMANRFARALLYGESL